MRAIRRTNRHTKAGGSACGNCSNSLRAIPTLCLVERLRSGCMIVLSFDFVLLMFLANGRYSKVEPADESRRIGLRELFQFPTGDPYILFGLAVGFADVDLRGTVLLRRDVRRVVNDPLGFPYRVTHRGD